MNTKIQIGKLGRIKAGDNTGYYLKIQDDSVNTGGFLILVAQKSDLSDGFDSWVENREKLAGYFDVSKWAIEWLE